MNNYLKEIELDFNYGCSKHLCNWDQISEIYAYLVNLLLHSEELGLQLFFWNEKTFFFASNVFGVSKIHRL